MTDAVEPTPTSSGPARTRARAWRAMRRHFVLVAIVLAMLGLLRHGLVETSPTSDEWAHFMRGVAWWTTDDTRLSYAHPPLANVIATAPILLEPEGAVPDVTALRSYEEGDIIKIYSEYFALDYARARAQLMRARAMMMVFPVALVVYAYYLLLRLWGLRAAVVGATLLAFDPTLLAHGRLVTTDLPAALGYLVAAGELALYLRGPPPGTSPRAVEGRGGWRSAVRLGLAATLPVVLKHSGVFVIPVMLAIGAIAAGWARGRFAGLTRRVRWRRFAAHVGIVTVVVALGINAAYRFQRTMWTTEQVLVEREPVYWVTRGYRGDMLEARSVLPQLPSGLVMPLPYTWIFGVHCIAAQNARGWHHTYFWGEARGNRPARAYFPTLVAIKTPLSVLGLVLLGLGLGLRDFVVRRRRPRPSLSTWVLLAMAAAFMALIVASRLNMGMRHALPVVPLLTVLAARVFDVSWLALARLRDQARRRLGQAGLVAVVATLPVVAWWASPGYLGYFNALVGREGGHRISIIGEDWGQDWVALAELADREGLAPLGVVAHTGVNRAELRWLGVDARILGCDDWPAAGSWAAIRAVLVLAVKNDCYQWARRAEGPPQYVIDDHVWVFRIEDGPPPDWAQHVKEKAARKRARRSKTQRRP